MVDSKAYKPQNFPFTISDNQLASFLKQGKLLISQKIADKTMSIHTERTELIACMYWSDSQRELNVYWINRSAKH